MFPTIFQAGPFRLSSYGLMITLAFIAGVSLSSWRSRRRGYPPNFIQDLAVVVLVSSIFGARLLYIVTHLEEFAGQWWRTIVPIQSDGTIGIAGLVLLGGVLGAIPAGIWYTLRKGQSVTRTMDIVAPAMALGIAIGRVGCLLNGCCFGKPCSAPWAIHFPADSWPSYMYHGLALHPTQIYSMGWNLLTALFLLWYDSRRHAPGQAFALFLVLYGPGRFVVEFFRYYEQSMKLFAIGNWQVTVSQLISLGMVAGGLWLYHEFGRRHRAGVEL